MNHKTIRNLFFVNLLLVVLLTIDKCKCAEHFDVTKYGADVKGVSKSTAAIHDAITAAVKNGGGTVYFPAGQYLTGPIHLKSNISLHLKNGVIINFSTDFDDYLPMVRMRWEGTELINFSPLIYADGAENITIRGRGILDGQGNPWWDNWKKLENEHNKTGATDSKWQKEFFRVNNFTKLETLLDDTSRIKIGFLRPPFIQLIDSKNIVIQDVTIRNSPFWNVNPVFCENFTITGVTIEAPYTIYNTDGIDPDSCKNVHISNVQISVGDDCIAIKSGRDLQGRQIGRPTENVVITNCTMLRGVSGVAIGSEQSGSVRNVTVTNCFFNGTDRGIYLKSRRGRGGVVEDIHFSDIKMKNIRNEGILFELFYGMSRNQSTTTEPLPFSEHTPVFRNIDITRVTGNAKHSAVLLGLPESPIENVTLSHVNIVANNGIIANNYKNLQLNNFTHNSNIAKF